MKLRVLIVAMLGVASAQAAFDWDPFYESLQTTNGATFSAWRPFYSSSVNGEHWRDDYLWPLYTRKGFKDETYGRLLFFGYSLDFSSNTDRHRTWVLPFYFQGTSAEGDNYFALFPFGGTIDEFAGRDRIMFVLFPLYARSSINDVKTTSVLWPIGSKTSGDGVERFRIWPLYGTSSLENQFNKKFVFWPIYTSVEYTNERNPGGGFILVPIYGRIVTEHAQNYWLVAPFFRYANGDDGQWIVHAPWPFIQLAGGKVYKRYFWPLYGKKQVGTLTKDFVCWPFIWNIKTQYPRFDKHRLMAIPFFYYDSETITKPTKQHVEGDVQSRYWKLWPLMSWDRREDQSRFRTLDLWPLRDTAGIERNWASFWTLYQRVDNEGVVGHHVLWGLYRQAKGNDQFEWSLLKGFAGYKRTGNKHSFRLLFMEFGGKEEQP